MPHELVDGETPVCLQQAWAPARIASVTREEIFDVVDTDDVVIGSATRSAVHANDWRHRSVHVLVFNRAGELYLQQRSLDKDTGPGLWDTSAAGHVGSGETYAAAAARETNEELGLPTALRFEVLFKLEASAKTGFEFVHVYRCLATTNIVPDKTEIMNGRYLSLTDLAAWLRREPSAFTTTFLQICEKLNWVLD